MPQPAVSPQSPRPPSTWCSERRGTVCCLFDCFFQEFFPGFLIFSPCFRISCGCLIGISVGIHEGKTQSRAFSNTAVDGRGGRWTRASRCWLRWEPAGCAHEPEIHSSASGMLRSKSKTTGKKTFLFLQGFSPAHYSSLPACFNSP